MFDPIHVYVYVIVNTSIDDHNSPYYHESEEKKNNVKPRESFSIIPFRSLLIHTLYIYMSNIEERSFRLWGRINPAHCVNPYMSEHQRYSSRLHPLLDHRCHVVVCCH
jgi:uncharacterized protein (DUF2461 family)